MVQSYLKTSLIMNEGSFMMRSMPADAGSTTFEKEGVIQIDAVHVSSALKALKAKKHGQKVVLYAQPSHYGKARNRLTKTWMKFCCRFIDIVITPTEYARNMLLDDGLQTPVYTLPGSVDSHFFKPDSTAALKLRESLCLDEDAKIVICAGQLTESKGLLDFIKVAEQMPEVSFLWYGNVPKRRLSGKVKKALCESPDNVCFMGFVEQEELRTAYQGANAFLFLSQEETEGTVLLEALACETPVIVKDIQVYRTWLDEEKIVYKVRDVQETMEKLRKIFAVPNQQMARHGRELAQSRNDELLGRQLMQIYELEGLD